MNKIIICVGMILVASSASAKVVQCLDSVDTSLSMTAKFDSSVPELTASVITYKPDGSVEHETKTEYMTPKSLCGVSTDFSSDCTSTERQSSLGYSYQFQCKSKKISGEFYVDENGNGNFSCSSQPGSSIFFGCTVQ
ncbi:MAG: hypothetical protein EOP06_11950 [Proteobacteria bacterium]|nr:MAG: hypothetical protein EOP06_11950 [Pseudomonadota bacterium]